MQWKKTCRKQRGLPVFSRKTVKTKLQLWKCLHFSMLSNCSHNSWWSTKCFLWQKRPADSRLPFVPCGRQLCKQHGAYHFQSMICISSPWTERRYISVVILETRITLYSGRNENNALGPICHQGVLIYFWFVLLSPTGPLIFRLGWMEFFVYT